MSGLELRNSMLRQTPEEEMAFLGICLADPLRIHIIRLIATDPGIGVNEIAERLDKAQPNVSQHLAMLRRHGMVRSDRCGTSVSYRIADRRILWWLEGLMRAWLADPSEPEAAHNPYALGGQEPAYLKGNVSA